MKYLKENQIIIYIAALMLITAGYLNYTDKQNNETAQASTTATATTNETAEGQVADIGDAALVNSEPTAEESSSPQTDDATQEDSSEQKGSSQQTINGAEAEASNTAEQQGGETSPVSSSDYFVTSKLERDKMYSQMLEVYQKVLDSSTSGEAQKQVAVQEIQKINNAKSAITVCENLIKTKGFNNCVIFVNGDSISAVVGSTGLTQEQVDDIQNLIKREMSAKTENIHIAIN